MVSTMTIRETIIAFLKPITVNEVTDHPTHKIVKLLRKLLAQISVSIKTTHATFLEGARYRFVAAILIESKYRKWVTTLDNTWKFSAPENTPNNDPEIYRRHSEVTKSSMEVSHKELQKKY